MPPLAACLRKGARSSCSCLLPGQVLARAATHGFAPQRGLTLTKDRWNAPAAPSRPAHPRPSQSVTPVNSGQLATTRTECAGILPDSSLPAASPPSARRLLPATAVVFASETSRVGQFTPVHY